MNDLERVATALRNAILIATKVVEGTYARQNEQTLAILAIKIYDEVGVDALNGISKNQFIIPKPPPTPPASSGEVSKRP